jgi:hypothetical protein
MDNITYMEILLKQEGTVYYVYQSIINGTISVV